MYLENTTAALVLMAFPTTCVFDMYRFTPSHPIAPDVPP